MDADGNRYGPYDIEVAGSEAEALTEDAWFDLFDHLSGVKSGGGLTFTGLTADLAAIDVRVHGSFLSREASWSDASPPTTGASPRRDLLVARRQRTSGEGESAVPGKTFLTVLRGTPAATPADPTYDVDDDEPLWSWQVPGGGGTVVTAVRDLRRTLIQAGGDRMVATMAVRPTVGRVVGMGVRPADRPQARYTWDGTRWVQDGVSAAIAAGAPAGSYVSQYKNSKLTTVTGGDGPGAYGVALDVPFSAAPLWSRQDIAAYSFSSQATSVVQLSNSTGTVLVGFALRADGTTVPNGQQVTVAYEVIGYNT